MGLSFSAAPVAVFCCLLVLPSVTSSGSGLVDDVGIGNAGRCVIGGAVATGDVGFCVLCCFFGEPSSFCSPVLSLPSHDVLVVASLCCFAACCRRCGNGSVVGVVVFGVVGVVSAGAGVFHGPMLITSKSCWLYLCGLICRRIVRARMILLYIPIRDSMVVVSFPSHIPVKKRGSSFGNCFIDETIYCTASPNSHSGVCCSLCHLL